MTPAALLEAVGKRLLTDAELPPVVWPNEHGDRPLPYLSVDYVPVSRRDETLRGEQTIARAFVMVTVMEAPGVFNTAANATAARIMALFPKGLRLTVPGGVAVIYRPAEDMQGFPDRDGAAWRLPVRIHLEAAATMDGATP